MQSQLAYRHELKYEIGLPEYLTLRQRLGSLLRRDAHVGAGGRYAIDSLYFDNCFDRALREKLDGVNRREKFRLRCYNGDLSRITLEKKQKVHQLCLKRSALIGRNCCQRLLQGDADWLPGEADELLQELDFKIKTQLLRPRTLVHYVREPYVYGPGNVRITFDMDLRTGLACTDFLHPGRAAVPVMPPGRMILEVKYDAFLPDVVADALQVGVLRLGAFSKYAACRQYE